MQKVIGLDIGSYSIKAVEIINTFNSYEITNFYENVIPHLEGVPLDAIVPNCMEQLFVENDLQADRIVTAMPGQFISSRILPFNFSDPRKIEQAAYAVVEEAVPFNMDDMILDHQILGQQSNKTLTLAVMTRKAFLKNFLDLLQRISIDPKLVDVDSLAFYNLSSYMGVDQDECFAMVDVGHEKTSLCIVRDGVLKMFRSINLGGRYVTEFLARDLEVSFQEAQRIKHKHSTILCSSYQGDELTGDDRLVAERMTLACNAIVKELGRTFYSFKNWEKTPLTKLFLSGGTSRTKNFQTFLEDQLEVDCSAIQLDETSLKMTDELHNRMHVIPQSVAIGMRAVTATGRNAQKYSQINLRKGEFAYVQNYESILKTGMEAFKLVAIVMLMFLVSYVAQSVFYGSKTAELEKKYQSQFLSVFGNQRSAISRRPTFRDKRKMASDYIDRQIVSKKRSIELFVKENSSSAPLVVLKEVSASIPKENVVDVVRFHIETKDKGNTFLMKAHVPDYQTVDEIFDTLAKTELLEGLQKKSQGELPGSKEGKKQFEVQLKEFEVM